MPEPTEEPKNDKPSQVVLTSAEAAKYIGQSPTALRMMRYRGTAPPHVLYGVRDKRYHVEDLDAWLVEKRKQSRPKRGRGRPGKGEVVLKSVMKPFIAVSRFVEDAVGGLDVKTASVPAIIILLILALLAGVI